MVAALVLGALLSTVRLSTVGAVITIIALVLGLTSLLTDGGA